ncbi:MAG TPA: M14 family metallopeptidase [Puia sp.]|jgi:predicted deacylase
MTEITDTIIPHHFAAKRAGPSLLISAGVHGDEFEPMLAAHELIRKAAPSLIAGRLTVVPLVNVSAYDAGSRYGSDGLDLARICPGNITGSISERYAAQISGMIRKADYYIDMHTGGNLFSILPLAGYMLHASGKILKEQRKMAALFNLPIIWGTEDAPNGRTLSVARDAGVASIYVEYGGGGSAKKEIIKAYTEGCLNVLESLQMISPRKKIKSAQKYWVEDYTPDGGYFQSKMRSPAEGIFSPAVKPGAVVKKMQVWGTITDPHSGLKKEILAEAEGLVLSLRMSAPVKLGDSLGGILPILTAGKRIIGKPDKKT